MTRRRSAGPVAALVSALLVLVGLVLVPASAARADFASQCASPDRVVSATDPAITVASGEVVLLAADFTGGVNALPRGGTLCVAPGATLTGFYMNNAEGAIVVAAGGALDLPSVVVAAGFSLELEGAAQFDGLGANGSVDVHVHPGGELVVGSSLSPGGGAFRNEGTFEVQGALNVNSTVRVENSGSLDVAGSANLDGTLDNSGVATFGSTVTINGSGSLQNTCTLSTAASLVNNASGSENAGIVTATGSFLNNGTWRQSSGGVLTAATLTDDGVVGGFGGYQFSGHTSVQGAFVGDSATDPVRVQSVAPPGQIFDVQTGTVQNVLRATVDAGGSPAGCAVPDGPIADVVSFKTGPAKALQGDTVVYEIVVANRGPDAAADVTVSDPLPAGFVLDPASTIGTVVGGALTWHFATLPAGPTLSLKYSGVVTAPPGSTLVNVVSSTSTTTDPSPSNNDGSAQSSRVSTEVVGAVPPPNTLPVAQDLVRDTTTAALVLGTVTASDPDAGQVLTFTLQVPPTDGAVDLGPSGEFQYRSDSDFAGVDTFTYQVCDNGSAPGCDEGLVTINVRPRAVDDLAESFPGVPVTVPVVANDTDGAPLDTTPVTPPTNGTVTLDPATGAATYTSSAGFTGVDTFEYRICSPSEPTFCDTALVTVTVVARNDPPTIAPLLMRTTTDVPVTDDLVVADPDADTVTTYSGIPPRSGTEVVEPDGSTTYSPRSAFAGRDQYGVFACDDGVPRLCATARVDVEVLPVALPDSAQTTAGTAVPVDVSPNDAGLVGPPALASPPSNGTATFGGTVARYLPSAGFVGTDSFTYTICATTAADLCATTTVTVVVSAVVVTPGPTPPPVTQVPGPAPGPGPGSGAIAATGAEPVPMLLLALALLLGGGALVRVARRRA